MPISEETLHRWVEETYGPYLSAQEIERLMPYVRRQIEVSDRLREFDLGRGDPLRTHYIRDRRLIP